MEMTKGRILQIVMAGVSLVMLVLSILCLGDIIQSSGNGLFWGILVLCFGFMLCESVVYFLLGNTETIALICKWLLVFFGVIILVVNTILLATGASEMFANFGATTGWLSFFLVLITYALCGLIIAFLIIADKEEKEQKALKRQQEETQDKQAK